ncbi:hypothetical protein FPQ18DRAFT_409124, partial [Pyronema domesticum]
ASAFSVSLCYGILVLIAGQATFACPHLRQKHHNTFEFTHRYFGWMTVFLTRLLVLTLTRDLTLISHQSLGMALISAPTFWFLLLIVVSIVSPRALTRRMPIKIQVLSRHARRIFVHDRRFAKAYPGSLVRLSTKSPDLTMIFCGTYLRWGGKVRGGTPVQDKASGGPPVP